MKKHYSLSVINIVLLISFLSVIIFPISFWTYMNFDKTMQQNFEEYFTQTKNIAEILLEQEAVTLENLSKEMISHTKLTNSNKIEMSSNLIDEVDIAFILQNGELKDYSTSLYDTNSLIAKLGHLTFSDQVGVFTIEEKEVSYLILLKVTKLINKENGRVYGYLFIGNILNDELDLMNKIKEKANMKEVTLYSSGQFIVSTQEKESLKHHFDKVNDSVVFINNEVFSKKRLEIFKKDYKLDLVVLLDSHILKTMKNNFKNQIYFLIGLILFIAIISYYLIRVIILNPMESLLRFANKVRYDSNAKYKETFIKEFNKIAHGLDYIIGNLRDIEERYRLAVDGTKEGLWDWNILNKTVFYSQRYEEMLGYKHNEMKSTLDSWSENIHPDFHDFALSQMKAHIKKEIPFYEAEYQMRCKDGHYKWVRVRGKALYNDKGIAYRMVGFHTDIDKMKLLEKKNKEQESILTQQSKMAAMGEMIKNISHQWRQPLSIISTVATGLKLQLEYNIFNKEEAVHELDVLNNTSQYLSGIIDQFRDFALDSKEKEEFDTGVILRKSIKLLENTFKEEHIELVENLENIRIFGFKNQLIQVILNMLNNAKDAVLKLNKNDKKFIFIESKRAGEYLIIRFYDNGGGVINNLKDKLYEPYTTNKHESQGTGLGLYTVKEIIEKQFNGTVLNQTINFEYENNAYVGEEFILKFDI